jgi:hypothetical protein
LVWAIASVFFHFSFLFPLFILFVFFILGNRLIPYLLFFIVTSFVKEINLQAVQSLLSFLPDFLFSRVSIYTNPEYVEALRSNVNTVSWFLPFSNNAIKWTIYSLVLFIYFTSRKHLKEKPFLISLFCFSLLFYGCANISSLVPSGGRFISIASSYIFAFFVLFITTFPKIRGLLMAELLVSPLLLFYCLVTLRIGMDFFSLLTVLGNPIMALFSADNTPVIIGLKRLL